MSAHLPLPARARPLHRSIWRPAHHALRSSLLLALVAALGVLARPALAGDEPAARSLFEAGIKLMDQGKVDAACPKFAESLRLSPSVGAELNLARCHAAQGKTASAWHEYRQAATMASEANDAERQGIATKGADELEAKLAKLVVKVAQPVAGLQVLRDGAAVGEASFGVEIAVDPGEHRIEAMAPGHKDWAQTVQVPAEPKTQTIEIPALEPGASGAGAAGGPGADAGSNDALWGAGIGLAATGVIAAGIGAVLGGLVLSDASSAQDDPTLCPNKQCTAAGRDQIDGAESKATASSVLIPVGGALAVAGIVVLVIAGTSSPGAGPATEGALPKARVVPMVGPNGAALALGGSF
jgi:hypothetical protein